MRSGQVARGLAGLRCRENSVRKGRLSKDLKEKSPFARGGGDGMEEAACAEAVVGASAGNPRRPRGPVGSRVPDEAGARSAARRTVSWPQ